MDQAPRILILRLSALGDVVHALPVLAAIRRQWPGAHVGWLVEPLGRAILEGNPLIDRLHVVPKKAMKQNFFKALGGPLKELRNELVAERYDISIDIQGLTKSAAWGWLAGAERRIGFAGAQSRELATVLNNERVAPPAEALHVIEKNLALLAPLGIEPRPIEFPLHLPAAAHARAKEIVEGSDVPVVMLNPGAGWETKKWPAERFGALAKALVERHQLRAVFSWGPGEECLVKTAMFAAGDGDIDPLMKSLPKGPGIYALPKTSIPELAAVISRAKLFVGGDTGPTHIAAALGVPTVTMMGPLDARRNGPYGAHCVTIQHAIPKKAPFWRNHKYWCDPETDLGKVTVEEVLRAAEGMMKKGA
ncbi:glycosyltransferase family 9 protein [bacterium]|nr:glycosyltransferase family 9 protein [bacterium]